MDYDPDGLAFGVGIDSQIIGLYDIRNHEKVCDQQNCFIEYIIIMFRCVLMINSILGSV